MYLPRLRRISDVLKEMKEKDEKTVISRHFIETLVHQNEITALKYGDAWLINLDELYLYLHAQKDILEAIPTKDEEIPRKMWTTGEIYRRFLKEDTGTIIRKPNMRRFVKANNIPYGVTDTGRWVINYESFIKAVNPKNLSTHVDMPRLRWHDDTVRKYQKRNPQVKITMKEIEELLRTDKIFTTLNGHRWIINYDELEREILKLKHTFIR